MKTGEEGADETDDGAGEVGLSAATAFLVWMGETFVAAVADDDDDYADDEEEELDGEDDGKRVMDAGCAAAVVVAVAV
mgnify:CR=1 FL=1